MFRSLTLYYNINSKFNTHTPHIYIERERERKGLNNIDLFDTDTKKSSLKLFVNSLNKYKCIHLKNRRDIILDGHFNKHE